jgi:pectin methylesterase-like acyl-CoA thioesterase
MTMRTIAVMSWWIVLCLPLAAQQTWKVSCHGGPGIHFTDVQAAVDAAAVPAALKLTHPPP